jgi:hypothetical protein
LRLQPALALATGLHALCAVGTPSPRLVCRRLLKWAGLRHLLDQAGTQLVHLLVDGGFDFRQGRTGMGLPPLSHGLSSSLASLLPLLPHLVWVHVHSYSFLLSRRLSRSHFTLWGSVQKFE